MNVEDIVKIAAQTGAMAALRYVEAIGTDSMKKTITDLAAKAVEAGEKAVKLEMKAARKRAGKEIRDRRLHNTRLLIKRYRDLKEHCMSAVYRSTQIEALEDDHDADIDIPDLTMEDAYSILSQFSNDDDVYIDSIKRSRLRTMIIIRHIDTMLELYDVRCLRSNMPNIKRQNRVLHAMYLDNVNDTKMAIATREHVNPRTIDKDIESAIEAITALLFGIDAIKDIYEKEASTESKSTANKQL